MTNLKSEPSYNFDVMQSSEQDLREAMQLIHDFFFYMVFDFDIKLVVNAVPFNYDSLHKIFC